MKVGLFNPYFRTMGGGERYFLTLAEFFLKRGDSTDIFWDGERDLTKIKTRFNLDLTGVNFVRDIFNGQSNRWQRIMSTTRYDLVFFLSDGSIPVSFARENILHFQVPFNRNFKTLSNAAKFLKVNAVVCNSQFTKAYIDLAFGIKSRVIYPPVDVSSFSPGKKENIILSVGRFFGPSHPKKQEIMIREFVGLYKKGLKNWKLILVGGLTSGNEEDVERLREKSTGYPIRIITDSSFPILKDYYGRAKIYWHAAGYGENLEENPQKAEHFGITTVEAMSAGCVPVVFAAGGQLEIVDDGKTGYVWKSTEELREKTLALAKDEKLLADLSQKAAIRSKDFSIGRFFDNWEALLSNL